MTWGIIGALDAEVALIRQEMDVEKTLGIYGADFSIGTIGKQRVAVVCSSIGTINAAVCTSVLIREFGARAVINAGIGGSISNDLGILDVAVSDDVLFHDADHSILEKYYPFKRSYQADRNLIERSICAVERLSGKPVRYKVGRIVSGDVFVNDRARKQKILSDYAPLCVDMEGAAVGQVATMCNVPFVVLRTMSDNADEDASQSYDNFLELAAYQSASVVLGIIRGA